MVFLSYLNVVLSKYLKLYKMKKLLIITVILTSLFSCSTDDTTTQQLPPSSSQKEFIYFSGWDESIGTLGVKWSELYRIKKDGSSQEKLTNYSNLGTVSGNVDYPILNSSSTKVYFSRENTIKVYDVATTATTNIYTAPATSGWISTTNQVFDNDTKIIFVEENDTKTYWNINVLDIQSGVVTLLTDAQDGSQSYSNPVFYNGKIYYSKTTSVWSETYPGTWVWANSIYEIYSMNIDGSNKTLLHQAGNWIDSIIVLNNTTIYFTMHFPLNPVTAKPNQVWKLDVGTGVTTQLSDYTLDGTVNELTLQDNELYYSSNKTGKYNIYKMNLDGSNKIMISIDDTVSKQNPTF